MQKHKDRGKRTELPRSVLPRRRDSRDGDNLCRRENTCHGSNSRTLYPRNRTSLWTAAEISQHDILYLLNENIVFRLNVLNILSTLSQRRNLKLWTTTSSETESHIIRFIHQHCRLQIGRKTIYIKMNSLAEAIHASRIEVSVALNKMNNERRIVLQRGIITIPEISQLNY